MSYIQFHCLDGQLTTLVPRVQDI